MCGFFFAKPSKSPAPVMKLLPEGIVRITLLLMNII